MSHERLTQIIANKMPLCWPEYSQPLDQVGREREKNRRVRVGLPDTPKRETVELVEAYCDPRDSRKPYPIDCDFQGVCRPEDCQESCYNCPGQCQDPCEEGVSPPEPAPQQPHGRQFSQPYSTDGSSIAASSSSLSIVSDEEKDEVLEVRARSASARLDPAYANVPARSATSGRRQPSPYYYGDLARQNKSATLGAPSRPFTVTEDGLFAQPDSDSSCESAPMPPRRSCPCRPTVFYLPADMTARARRLYETAFDCKVARSDDDLDDVDRVSNHPILLQLGGEGCKIDSFPSSSSSTIDPSLAYKNRRKHNQKSENSRRPKPAPMLLTQENVENVSAVARLSEELENLELNNAESRETVASQLPLRGYTPSPPSTAPLPTKFQQGKDLAMNSIKSAPNLPSSQPAHPRLKDLRLPVKSLRARETIASSDGSMAENKGRSNNNSTEFECSNRVRNMIRDSQDRISEIKSRPRLHNSLFLEIKNRAVSDTDTPEMQRVRGSKESGPILEFKGRPANRRRHNYSSTESMATSSSGGSMESIRSSTSEGNRSTSSSESRHSASLSSHSSDSGNNSCFQNIHRASPLSGFISHHANKLHILSPISDKSSQEPVSETSDNNKNNNSQKVSPDENTEIANQAANQENITSIKIKRRPPQNRNLLNLAFQHATSGDIEIQGSDSGISIHSREGGIKSRNAFLGFLKLNQMPTDSNSGGAVDANNGQVDFSDLPFDMPKLRRRRAAAQDACTSGSATSVDLRELPFDMPKLRRRLRAPVHAPSPASSGGSHASLSHGVKETDHAQVIPRPTLTLNLEEKGSAGVPLNPGEASRSLNLNFGASSNVPVLADVVDTALPLERQGWYHGAMTRVEAENVLRGASEGGFLVRNSESARRDFSLSLKSARGFMHMRIQQSEDTGRYILGQFSRPFDTIPEMIRHFCLNRLPVRGAEHMCLSKPVIAQLL